MSNLEQENNAPENLVFSGKGLRVLSKISSRTLLTEDGMLSGMAGNNYQFLDFIIIGSYEDGLELVKKATVFGKGDIVSGPLGEFNLVGNDTFSGDHKSVKAGTVEHRNEVAEIRKQYLETFHNRNIPAILAPAFNRVNQDIRSIHESGKPATFNTKTYMFEVNSYIVSQALTGEPEKLPTDVIGKINSLVIDGSLKNIVADRIPWPPIRWEADKLIAELNETVYNFLDTVDFEDLDENCLLRRLNDNYSREALASNTKVLIGAIEDTTASTLSGGLAHLAEHPGIQAQLRHEIKKSGVFADIYSEEVDYGEILKKLSDGKQFPQLHAYVTEMFRFLGAAVQVQRETYQDHEMPGGYTIKEGTIVFGLLPAMNRDPKVWKNGHVFDHNRFLKDPSLVNQIMTFSKGSRGCLGEPTAMGNTTYTVARMIFDNILSLEEGVKAADHVSLGGTLANEANITITPIKAN